MSETDARADGYLPDGRKPANQRGSWPKRRAGSPIRWDAFQVFLNDKDDPDSIAQNDIWSLYQDRSGLIWIGTVGGGLNQLNPSTHRLHTLRAIPFNKNSLTSGFVWGIDEDANHRIWMATLAGRAMGFPRIA